jgi:hypothetical protein
MSSTITKAFIPRVLPNVTISQIRDVFAAKQIGKVININMHHRKNEKNNQYSFVFIDLILYNTKEANDLNEDITNAGVSKVFYDKKNYWEVKPFLSKSQRISMITFPEEKPEQFEHLAEEQHEEISSICSDLLTPTYSYDIALQRMSVHSQLLRAHYMREVKKSTCCNCGSSSNSEYDRSIFWKTYSFCSEKCQWESEWDIRKSWSRAHSNQEHQSYMNNYDTTTENQSSKFIEMFQRIQEEEAAKEMQNIRSLCYELIKRPTIFTAQDRKEMEQDYEELVREIIA